MSGFLRTACQQNKSWQEAGLKPIPVAVNFSPRQFQQTELLPLVDRVLSDTGLDPKWLEVEITETSLLHDFNAARESLNDLQNRGILLSMDDFGTGYSSLSYLQQFSFNTLKIDRSFITDLSEKSRDMAIVLCGDRLRRELSPESRCRRRRNGGTGSFARPLKLSGSSGLFI